MNINLRVVLIGVVALVTGAYLQLFGFNLPLRTAEVPQPEIENFFWPEQKALSSFQLTGSNNSPYGINEIHDKWSFVFFGYTHCPDICPITMNTLRQAREQMATESIVNLDQVNFLFVSVDGERDTPAHLDSYISFFGQNFTAATGTPDQVDSLTRQLGVPYSIDEHEPGDSDYLVGHSAAIFLISPSAKLASIYHAPHNAKQITRRFTDILRFYSSQS